MSGEMSGLIAAVFTPMDETGAFRPEGVAPMVERLASDGVSGLYVCGSTGEGVSLSAGERRAVAEGFIAAARGRMPVIVHAGHDSTAEARALAGHAREAGADAVAALPPHCFRPGTAPELAACMAEVASGAPDLPFYYYHIPALSGVNVPMRDFLEAAAGRIPNLAGIKFTHEDLMDLLLCRAFEGGRFEILFGRDEMLLAGLAMGIGGAVGATYNWAAPLYRRMWDAFDRGDVEAARREQGRAADMVRVMRRVGGLRAGKAIMKLSGMDCGPCRPPNGTLGGAEARALEEDLRAIGFFDWARA